MQTLEALIYQLFDNLRRNLSSAPLNLGGIGAPDGGGGGPPGGFIGKLPQTQVTYDTSEAATLYTPLSGYSLLNNLNHIRYRIQELEGGSSIIMSGEDVIASGVLILKFDNNFEVTPITSGIYISLVSGVQEVVGDYDYTKHIYNESITSTGTSHTTNREFTPNSLRLYVNGVRQDSSQFTEDGDCLGFTTVFSVPSGTVMEVDYSYISHGDATIANIQIQENGELIASGITVINFVGATVAAIPAGVTVTFSGTTSSGTGTTDHTELSNIGTTTHDQIDIALARLATTSGTNSGDQDLSDYITDAPEDDEQYGRKNGEWVVISGVTTSGVASGTTNHAELDNLDYANSGHTGFEPTKGENDNYVTDAQIILLTNLSGSNSGDVTVADTSTVNLTLDGQLLSADVIPSGISHTALLDIGTNTHAQIDNALSRLATTSGNNSGDQDLSDYLTDSPSDSETYGRNNGAWVVVSGGTGTGVEEAPIDGEAYNRKDGEWVIASGVVASGVVPQTHEVVSGYCLTGYDSETGLFNSGAVALSGESGASNLTDLQDVTISGTVVNGQTIVYSGGTWYEGYPGATTNLRTGLPVNIWVGTEAQYAEIAIPDPNTLYFRSV